MKSWNRNGTNRNSEQKTEGSYKSHKQKQGGGGGGDWALESSRYDLESRWSHLLAVWPWAGERAGPFLCLVLLTSEMDVTVTILMGSVGWFWEITQWGILAVCLARTITKYFIWRVVIIHCLLLWIFKI